MAVPSFAHKIWQQLADACATFSFAHFQALRHTRQPFAMPDLQLFIELVACLGQVIAAGKVLLTTIDFCEQKLQRRDLALSYAVRLSTPSINMQISTVDARTHSKKRGETEKPYE
jgi:hypothetical protein